jgi:hypothetical protein
MLRHNNIVRLFCVFWKKIRRAARARFRPARRSGPGSIGLQKLYIKTGLFKSG